MLRLAIVASIFACIQTATTPTVTADTSICKGSSSLFPHPTSCQRYTNCSKVAPHSYSRYFKDYEEECPYPHLFDITENKCKHFREAECGSARIAAKEPCEYLKNKCGGAHCEPCQSRLPSCVKRTNGIHAHPMKLWSPYFIECDTERTIGVRWCPKHSPTDSIALFSPDKKACVSRWEIPREQGGLEPSCEGKDDRMYQVANRTDVFYACPGPRVSYCGNGSSFNESTQVCEQTTRKSV
uniref:Chitin-binding type-2 domain-containing protein n=1 Tax=Arion vulgaris TaxID=1028688 RepID=A0A0B6YCU2_9EUPU